MSGETLATLLILTSAFLHATWNAAVKHSPDRFATVLFVTSFGGFLYLPFIPFTPLPDAEMWPWLVASGITHLLYQLCLARMMDQGALTLVYPVARGTGPLLVALFSYFFLSGTLSLAQLGLITMLIGGIFLTAKPDDRSPANPKAVLAALATGSMIATYTIIDGLAVKRADEALTFIIWSGIVAAPLIFLVGLKQRGLRIITEAGRVWRQGLPASFMAHGGYALALYAFSIGNLGEIAALRETSIVFATLIGVLWLKESIGLRRIAAIFIIALAALCLKLL